MSEMWPTTSEDNYIYLQYLAHIAIMMGKEREIIKLDGINTFSDLLSRLDEKTPGIKELFMPPDDVFNVRTAVVLKRAGQARAIIDPQEKIEANDELLLW